MHKVYFCHSRVLCQIFKITLTSTFIFQRRKLCGSYRNIELERQKIPCTQCKCGYNYDLLNFKKRRCLACGTEHGCFEYKKKWHQNCADCPYGSWVNLHDAERCRPCCRGYFDGKLKCASCSRCPEGSLFPTRIDKDYCRPVGCTCGTVGIARHDIYACKPCNCKCGVTHRHETRLPFCSPCGCKHGVC